MKKHVRIGFTAAVKTELWDRWKQSGEYLTSRHRRFIPICPHRVECILPRVSDRSWPCITQGYCQGACWPQFALPMTLNAYNAVGFG